MTEIIETGPFAGLRKNGYGTILADPAWTFETYSDKGKDRSPEQHYKCMSIDDIKALPVGDLAADDCALFLWAIHPMLDVAFEVLEAWGFKFITVGFTWVKLNKNGSELLEENDLNDGERRPGAYFTGMGFWTRANPELCLFAKKGKPKRIAKDVRELVVAQRREHSRKPDCIHDRIEALVPGPRVELFGRAPRAGWDLWGDEGAKFSDPLLDVGDIL